MNTLSRLLSIGTAALAAASLSACASARSAQANASRWPSSDVRAESPAAADALRSTLAKDGRLPDGANVDVNPATGVVTLSGRVASAEERESAGRVACSVKGVTVVYNELEVRRAAR